MTLPVNAGERHHSLGVLKSREQRLSDSDSKGTTDTKGREKMKWTDGKEYPVVKVEVSSESHSYYTGKQKIVDTAGRVEKFKRRYTKKAK